MREMRLYKKGTQYGDVDIRMRIFGRIIYFKSNNNSAYLHQIIAQMKQKGALIKHGRTGSWLKVDLFYKHVKKGNTFFNFGAIQIDLEKDTDEEIEEKLIIFYTQLYTKAGFKLK